MEIEETLNRASKKMNLRKGSKKRYITPATIEKTPEPEVLVPPIVTSTPNRNKHQKSSPEKSQDSPNRLTDEQMDTHINNVNQLQHYLNEILDFNTRHFGMDIRDDILFINSKFQDYFKHYLSILNECLLTDQ